MNQYLQNLEFWNNEHRLRQLIEINQRPALHEVLQTEGIINIFYDEKHQQALWVDKIYNPRAEQNDWLCHGEKHR